MVETTRRREIEAAASTLFHERGYSGTSVRDIARALDIQGASLYAHVASKRRSCGRSSSGRRPASRRPRMRRRTASTRPMLRHGSSRWSGPTSAS